MTLPEIGPDPPQQRATDPDIPIPWQITGRHDPPGLWRGRGPSTCHGFCPPRPLGAAQLCAVGELTNNDQGVTGGLTRRWAVGPANYLRNIYCWAS